MYKARAADFEKLAELRNYDLEGRRELFLFLYRYYATLATGDEEEAENMTIALNDKLLKSISPSEIRSTKSNYVGKYYYKNETLIELFDITNEEMRNMKSIMSKEFKYEKNNARRRQSRRDKDGLTKRERDKRNNMICIVKGMLENKKTAEIAKENDLSVRLVQKYKKELKDNKELYIEIRNEVESVECENNTLNQEVDKKEMICSAKGIMEDDNTIELVYNNGNISIDEPNSEVKYNRLIYN